MLRILVWLHLARADEESPAAELKPGSNPAGLVYTRPAGYRWLPNPLGFGTAHALATPHLLEAGIYTDGAGSKFYFQESARSLYLHVEEVPLAKECRMPRTNCLYAIPTKALGFGAIHTSQLNSFSLATFLRGNTDQFANGPCHDAPLVSTRPLLHPTKAYLGRIYLLVNFTTMADGGHVRIRHRAERIPIALETGICDLVYKFA